MSAAALQALRERFGADRLRDDRETLERYGRDRTTQWQPAPLAVVFPARVDELQAIVSLARSHGLALVPSGGRTGLSGGAVAARGELVVAMERMNRLLEIDTVDRTITVEAGMLTAEVQQHAQSHGLYYPVDFAAAGSSQIGGNLATNAGGIKVIRHGMTRAQVAGLTVVDGRGEVLSFNHGLVKNNTGPDLGHVFVGSEGAFGIIASATLRLQQPPGELRVLLFAVRDFLAIPLILRRARALELSAFEFFGHNALERVLERASLRSPLSVAAPFYALIEHELRDPGAGDRALALFDQCVADGWVQDGVQSESLAQARELWRLREDISETLARWTPWKSDVSVRVSRMAAFIQRIEALAAKEFAGLELAWYGHIGDGNLHLNILRPEAMAPEEFTRRCAPAARHVAELVREFEGSVSAEHGIGLLKKDYLDCTLGPAEIERLRALKRLFDPDGIMNPGKLIDP